MSNIKESIAKSGLNSTPSIKKIYEKYSKETDPRIPFTEVVYTYFNSSKTDKSIIDATASSAIKKLATRLIEKGVDFDYKNNATPIAVRTLRKEIDRRIKGYYTKRAIIDGEDTQIEIPYLWEYNRDLLFEICIVLQVNSQHKTNAADWFELLGLDFARYSLWNEVLYRWCLEKECSYSEYINLRTKLESEKFENYSLDFSEEEGSIDISMIVEEPGEYTKSRYTLTDEIEKIISPQIYSDSNVTNEDFIEIMRTNKYKFHGCSLKRNYILFYKILNNMFDKIYSNHVYDEAMEEVRNILSQDYSRKIFKESVRNRLNSLKSRDIYAFEKEELSWLISVNEEMDEDFRDLDLDEQASYKYIKNKYSYLKDMLMENKEFENFVCKWDALPFGKFNFSKFFRMYTFQMPIDRNTIIISALAIMEDSGGAMYNRNHIAKLLNSCGYPVLSKSRNFDNNVIVYLK